MEFGKLDDISNVDWKLPADDQKNKERLGLARKNQIFLGSPAWGSKHWVNKIYPKNSSPDEYLYYYSRNFSSIELNTSFYRIPDGETCKGWLSQTPEAFSFCPKVHKSISHDRFGLGDRTLLKPWLAFLENISSKLGPSFIQLHENFSYEEKVLLFKFLENWPDEFRLCIELRHPSWFQEGKVLPALGDYLSRRGLSLVITDVAGRRDILHSTLSSSYTMIRLIGNSLDPSDEKRIKDWCMRLKEWERRGVHETYLFLHQPDDILTIEFAELAQKHLCDEGFENIPPFKRQSEATLFDFLSES